MLVKLLVGCGEVVAFVIADGARTEDDAMEPPLAVPCCAAVLVGVPEFDVVGATVSAAIELEDGL